MPAVTLTQRKVVTPISARVANRQGKETSMTDTLHNWSQGFGVIQHDFLTRERIDTLLETLAADGTCSNGT